MSRNTGSKLPPVKAVGKEIPVDNLEEVYSLASKGIKFTQNMQAIKPHYQVVTAMKEAGITNEDIFLAMDAIKGNPDALAEFIKKSGVDDLSEIEDKIDEGKGYTPEARGSSMEQAEVEEIAKNILSDTQYGEKVKSSLNEAIPEDFRDSLLSDAGSLEIFYQHVKDGTFDAAKPYADKIALMNPGIGYEQAYIQAVDQLAQTQRRVIFITLYQGCVAPLTCLRDGAMLTVGNSNFGVISRVQTRVLANKVWRWHA